MSPTYIPKGYRTVNPYLTVEGGQKLIEFLQQVFGAEQLHCETRDDGTIANAAMRIGDSVIELSDAREQWPAVTGGIHIFVPDCDAAFQRAIDFGASRLYEPADMPYGERSGGVTDPTGNNWYIATHLTGEYAV
jgi:uncharacterized glyoxalase superfamily protein PhnB